MRAVIVDDNAGVCSALSIIMQEWSHEVVSTDTLVEAVSRASASNFNPDVIVLNIPSSYYLNDADSINAISDILLRFFSSSSVIAMTGNSDPQIQKVVSKYGWPLLLKPFSVEALHMALAKAARKYQS